LTEAPTGSDLGDVETVKSQVAQPGLGISPMRAWMTVLICMFGYLISFIDRQILTLLIGPIGNDLDLSDLQFGLLSGLAFSIFYGLLGLPIAGLADRHSRPMVISVGMVIWSTATAACGLATNFLYLFVARMAVGVGEAALTPASYSLIADLFSRERLGRALAIYSLGSFFGAGLAMIVGGAVIGIVTAYMPQMPQALSLLRPWQIVFIIVGLPGVLLSMVVLFAVPEPRQRISEQRPSFAELLGFIRAQRRMLMPCFFGFAFYGMALYGVLGWSPAYLMRIHGISASEAGYRLGILVLLTGPAGVLASGWLTDRLWTIGHRDAAFRTGVIGAACTAAGAAMIPFCATLNQALVALAITFFFASFPMPPSASVLQIAAPKYLRSRISAMGMLVNTFVASALGSAVIGALNDHVFGGHGGTGLSMSVTIIFGAGMAAILLGMGCPSLRAFFEAQSSQ
jgi:MFS family permease